VCTVAAARIKSKRWPQRHSSTRLPTFIEAAATSLTAHRPAERGMDDEWPRHPAYALYDTWPAGSASGMKMTSLTRQSSLGADTASSTVPRDLGWRSGQRWRPLGTLLNHARKLGRSAVIQLRLDFDACLCCMMIWLSIVRLGRYSSERYTLYSHIYSVDGSYSSVASTLRTRQCGSAPTKLQVQ
jgi:hypothetical protein